MKVYKSSLAQSGFWSIANLNKTFHFQLHLFLTILNFFFSKQTHTHTHKRAHTTTQNMKKHDTCD